MATSSILGRPSKNQAETNNIGSLDPAGDPKVDSPGRDIPVNKNDSTAHDSRTNPVGDTGKDSCPERGYVILWVKNSDDTKRKAVIAPEAPDLAEMEATAGRKVDSREAVTEWLNSMEAIPNTDPNADPFLKPGALFAEWAANRETVVNWLKYGKDW
jgi:hypothetical protein